MFGYTSDLSGFNKRKVEIMISSIQVHKDEKPTIRTFNVYGFSRLDPRIVNVLLFLSTTVTSLSFSPSLPLRFDSVISSSRLSF